MNKVTHEQFSKFDLRRIGTELEIVGVVYGNGDENVLIALPENGGSIYPTHLLLPNTEQWVKIIRQSDLKETMAKDSKIVLRKSSRQIDQRIAWEVYRRDNFTCRYCGDNKSPMTVDHVVTWEEGGPTIPMNLITSCKKCNNTRGNMDYQDWLRSDKYLQRSKDLCHKCMADNARVIADVPYIREHHLQPRKKSR